MIIMDMLPITEDLDFHYLLELMPLLSNEPEYAWLPELFSTIGYRSFIKLCRYAGGELIRIPTVDELDLSIAALQWFYDTEISKKFDLSEIPEEYSQLVMKIRGAYDAEDS